MAFDTIHCFSTGFKRLFNRIGYLPSLLCIINRLLFLPILSGSRAEKPLTFRSLRGVSGCHTSCFIRTLAAFIVHSLLENVNFNLHLLQSVLIKQWCRTVWSRPVCNCKLETPCCCEEDRGQLPISTPKVSIHSDSLFILVIFCCQ